MVDALNPAPRSVTDASYPGLGATSGEVILYWPGGKYTTAPYVRPPGVDVARAALIAAWIAAVSSAIRFPTAPKSLTFLISLSRSGIVRAVAAPVAAKGKLVKGVSAEV